MEMTTYKVASLVEKCARGELLLPEIQRGFVWKQSQICELADSLYRDYPSGTLLAWATDSGPRTRRFGVAGDAPPPSSADGPTPASGLLILDGQQRLTALYGLFGHPIHGRPVRIVFNVEDEQFRIGRGARTAYPWVEVREVLTDGAIAIVQRLGLLSSGKGGGPARSLTRDLARLNQLERIREYPYQVFILRDLSYAQVTDIFQRVNSKGTRLQQSELAIAELAFQLPGMVADRIGQFLAICRKNGFSLGTPYLVRCLQANLALSTGQKPRADFRIFQEQLKAGAFGRGEALIARLDDAWTRTQRGVETLLNLLRDTLGIQSLRWIGSENALVIPAVYLANAEHPQPRLMLTWLLHALMWRRYSSAAETALDQDFAALLVRREPDMPGLLAGIAREVTADDLFAAGPNSAFKTLLYLVMRARGAEDWAYAGARLSADSFGEHALSVHHIFPVALLRKARPKVPKAEINALANITFLARGSNSKLGSEHPNLYLPALQSRGRHLLRAHLIPEDAWLWEREQYPQFLARRRELIARAINEYLAELCRDEMSPKR